MITHEKLKTEIIEAIRFKILSSCSRECPVQSQAMSRDYTTLISIVLKNEEGASRWDSGVLEYQYVIGISTPQLSKILCVISSDNDLIEIIRRNQKRADDALANIYQLQTDSYDKKKQDDYEKAVNIFEATNYFKKGILSGVVKDSEAAL